VKDHSLDSRILQLEKKLGKRIKQLEKKIEKGPFHKKTIKVAGSRDRGEEGESVEG